MSDPSGAQARNPLYRAGFAVTERRDLWWMEPLLTVLGLGVGFGYLTWAAFLGNPEHGHYGPYLSPVYSPPVYEWFPSIMTYLPAFVSPALLILWAPGGFRATCYYYRKAYYRSFFLNPASCAVGKPWEKYCGETEFPLVVQNIHRYFMYLAVVILAFLWYDALKAFTRDGPKDYVAGAGSVVLLLNAVFLSLYTLGCHSLRHLIGGYLDCFSTCPTSKLRHTAWGGVTCLNERHMLWAWVSLGWVGFTDLYIRLVSSGRLADPVLF
ncbi:MAG: hypothetical protein A3G34_02545 [Candidatus Lindowbacteria bacterium RIFCSPLOWO2_12_FULL_62_27]|nr:MAG: hypothetical protein A3G34_02545 [Candidatus Lindowbacteria bacterium RIFCSPLOWO2_12_FULL_62_27]OGH62835.1 MAG: hypothetical protein A3I06_11200 [Candidatus Lindowbacteria bacterium RIFCSPLOWO2_02_FULL_62_12]